MHESMVEAVRRREHAKARFLEAEIDAKEAKAQIDETVQALRREWTTACNEAVAVATRLREMGENPGVPGTDPV